MSDATVSKKCKQWQQQSKAQLQADWLAQNKREKIQIYAGRRWSTPAYQWRDRTGTAYFHTLSEHLQL